MNTEIIHSLILILCICFGFILPKTNLANYDLQIIAFLFIVLFTTRRWIAPNKSRLMESVIFTLVILFVVNTTGGLASPFFFLLYFLLFSLSLLLEAIIPATTALTLIIFFMLTSSSNQPEQFIPLFALAFLTPFALYMGKERTKIKNSESRIQNLNKTITKSKEETFLFLSLIIRNHLRAMTESVDNFMGDHELLTIRKHIRNIERLIEKFEKQT